MMRHLLLVGGGHSHLEVVRRLGERRRRNFTVTLLSPSPNATYSGMLPGLVAGHYAARDIQIDLRTLCAQADVQLHEAWLTRLALPEGQVHCHDGSRLPFDVLSLGTGSAPETAGVPGAFEHTVSIKPFESFHTRWEEVCRTISRSEGPREIVVVGGGVGGVELLLGMQHRLEALVAQRSRRPRFSLVAPSLVSDQPAVVQTFFENVLRDRGIQRLRARAERVTRGRVAVSGGDAVPADWVVWTTGASPPAWIEQSGLSTDSHGFVSVGPDLRSLSHPKVFAAGDVASLQPHPAPKSGVYAVRQGPLLFHNLWHAMTAQGSVMSFHPQPRALALITLGPREAVATYGNFSLRGTHLTRRALWHVKDRIDRTFVARYGNQT